jgi:hypothetical protein
MLTIDILPNTEKHLRYLLSGSLDDFNTSLLTFVAAAFYCIEKMRFQTSDYPSRFIPLQVGTYLFSRPDFPTWLSRLT